MLLSLVTLLVHIAVGIFVIAAVAFAVANVFRAGVLLGHPIAQGSIVVVGTIVGFAVWL